MNAFGSEQQTHIRLLMSLGIGVLVIIGGAVLIVTARTGDSSVAAIRSSTGIPRSQDSSSIPNTKANTEGDQSLQFRAALQECLDSSRAALEENSKLRREIDELQAQRITSRDPQSGVTSEGAEVGGMRMGEWTERYPNGQLRTAGSYLYGKEVGEWKYWNESGDLRMKGLWSNGQKMGAWLVFDHDANTVTEITYVNGVPTEATSK